ncbi:uncharacterized protein JCM10292_004717 [Rhodotorula paludigena]|uniref:uncharacterized protein n=1 Tax=Rhodotorula paludigena TaxID=86838 RepID=UPI003174114F
MSNKNWTDVELNLNATVAYGVELIAEASAKGARLIAFPEVWFPGYPKGLIAPGSPNAWLAAHVEMYINNSLVVGSEQWDSLAQAARDNEIYVAIGYSERTATNLYMAQALFDPNGDVLIRRHKLRPSASERDLWSDGTTDMIIAVNTPIGRIGLLECGEHTAPEATWLMQAQTEDIHVGSWPMVPAFGNATAQSAIGMAGYETAEVITALGRVYSILSNAVHVQSAIGTSTIYPAGSSAEWSQLSADESIADSPIVYRSVDGTGFGQKTYDVNGEVSWGTLNAINKGFPAYIPHVEGSLVPFRDNQIEDLLKLQQ